MIGAYEQRWGAFVLREEDGVLTLTCHEVELWSVAVPFWRWRAAVEGQQIVCREGGAVVWRVVVPPGIDLRAWRAWGDDADEVRDAEVRAWRARQGGVS